MLRRLGLQSGCQTHSRTVLNSTPSAAWKSQENQFLWLISFVHHTFLSTLVGSDFASKRMEFALLTSSVVGGGSCGLFLVFDFDQERF